MNWNDSHKLNQISAKLDTAIALLRAINRKETLEMKALDDLKVQVAAETDATGAAVKLLGGLKTQLDALIASGADPAEFQALSDQIGANTKALADAVTANTPAAPAPAP